MRKNEEFLIILDQYKEKLFNDQNFIKILKPKIFNIKSELKVVISSSMNDGQIRDEYLNIIKDNFNSPNGGEIKENKKEEREEEENKGRKEGKW